MKFSWRNAGLFLGCALAILGMYISDPNGGALTVATLLQVLTATVAVGFAHLARKTLFDYINMGDLYRKAKESAVGAAITFAGICIVLYGLLGLFGGQVRAEEGVGLGKPVITEVSTGKISAASVPGTTEIPRRTPATNVKTTIPNNAYALVPVLVSEQRRLWSSHPNQRT
jgi:hypothetical protein